MDSVHNSLLVKYYHCISDVRSVKTKMHGYRQVNIRTEPIKVDTE